MLVFRGFCGTKSGHIVVPRMGVSHLINPIMKGHLSPKISRIVVQRVLVFGSKDFFGYDPRAYKVGPPKKCDILKFGILTLAKNWSPKIKERAPLWATITCI